jgi:glutathionylspermidine synthase
MAAYLKQFNSYWGRLEEEFELLSQNRTRQANIVRLNISSL